VGGFGQPAMAGVCTQHTHDHKHTHAHTRAAVWAPHTRLVHAELLGHLGPGLPREDALELHIQLLLLLQARRRTQQRRRRGAAVAAAHAHGHACPHTVCACVCGLAWPVLAACGDTPAHTPIHAHTHTQAHGHPQRTWMSRSFSTTSSVLPMSRFCSVWIFWIISYVDGSLPSSLRHLRAGCGRARGCGWQRTRGDRGSACVARQPQLTCRARHVAERVLQAPTPARRSTCAR
jgi:hypothetical protein